MQHRARFLSFPPKTVGIHQNPPFEDWGPDGAGNFDIGAQVGECILAKVYNRTGGATIVGDLLQFDVAASQAETVEGDQPYPDRVGSCWRNVIFAGAQALDSRGVLCVALEAAADNAELWVCVQGIVSAMVVDSIDTTVNASDLAVADVLSSRGVLCASISSAGSVLAGDNTAYTRRARILVDQTVVTDTAELVKVEFFGYGMAGTTVSLDQT